MNIFGNRKVTNLFNIFVIGPLLIALSANKIPEEYKKYVIIVGILLILYNLLEYFFLVKVERLSNDKNVR